MDRMGQLRSFVASLPEPKRPPVVIPDEQCMSAEQIFRHVDPDAVPEIADVLEYLMIHHPQVLAAVGDVDRTLIWCAMEQGPLDNLAEATRMGGMIERLADAMNRAA